MQTASHRDVRSAPTIRGDIERYRLATGLDRWQCRFHCRSDVVIRVSGEHASDKGLHRLSDLWRQGTSRSALGGMFLWLLPAR